MAEEASGDVFVPVHSCWRDGEAEVILSFLAAHGIRGRANSDIAHTVLPIITDGLGEVQILVPRSSEEAARAFLEERASEGTEEKQEA